MREAADALGYRPHAALSALVNFRRDRRASPMYKIAYVIPVHEAGRQLGNHRRIISAARARAELLGCTLEAYRTDRYTSPEHLREVLRNRGVDALIFGRALSQDYFDCVDWGDFTVVTAGLGHTQGRFHTVSGDQHQAVLLAASMCRSYGYRRIAWLMGAQEPLILDDIARHSAALYVTSRNVPADGVAIPPFLESLENEQRVFAYLRRHRPDCVVCANPKPRLWLHKLFAAAFVDPALVTLCLFGEDGKEQAGIYAPARQIGSVAADFVVALARANQRGVPDEKHVLVVPPIWRDGADCPDLTALASSAPASRKPPLRSA